ncbi:MAG: helix-turn-helix transcriptional regulator [Oscillospiraceae bacterium]|nr:helix-turn-helix transcriptional regulator [Oscillospiraceae bacterium]
MSKECDMSGINGEAGTSKMSGRGNGMNAFGEWMKSELQEANMSQKDLAKIMKTDAGFICKLVNGKLIPSGTTIIKLLDIFNAYIVFKRRDEHAVSDAEAGAERVPGDLRSAGAEREQEPGEP